MKLTATKRTNTILWVALGTILFLQAILITMLFGYMSGVSNWCSTYEGRGTVTRVGG